MQLKVYKSKAIRSLLGLMNIHASALIIIGLPLLISTRFQLSEFDLIYLWLLLPYSIGIFIWIGYFNNDVVINDGKIEIVNGIPFFKKRLSYDFQNITKIVMRHDWTETFAPNMKSKIIRYVLRELAQIIFPYNYKWIKIEAGDEFKFFCFGIDFDYHENDAQSFEDLYKDLRRKQLSVYWTTDMDPYYNRIKDMTE